MNNLLLRLNPYMLLIKIAGAALFVLAMAYAWHQFTGHYVDIGKAQIQALWNKQKAVDQQYAITQLGLVRDKEKHAAQVQAAALNQLEKEKSDELKAKDNTIANLNAGIKRMRVITGNNESSNNLSNTSTTPGIHLETCSVRIPREIGDTAIGIGAEADEVADQLRACQAIVTEDRKVMQ